jgi:conjugal transfer ATP-binding protein TraC
MNTALSTELPFWEFQSNPIPHVILWDGSVASSFEILPLDIECFDEGRINQLTMSLRALINSLPDGLTAQFFVKVDSNFSDKLSKHTELRTTGNEYLKHIDQNRIKKIEQEIGNGFVFAPKLYFSLKTNGAQRPCVFSLSQTKKFLNDYSKNFEERLQVLSQALESAKGSMSSLGFAVANLDKDQLIKNLYQYLNPTRSKNIESPRIHASSVNIEGESPRSQICFGDLVLDQEDFILDSNRARVITLKTLPEMTFAGMMSGFLALPFKYELMFSFTIPDQAKEMASLGQKRRLAHSIAAGSRNKVSDLESESRLSQTTDLIREIIETGQKIFSAEMVLILRDSVGPEGARRLNLYTKEVLSRFRTLSGSEGIQETVGSWKIFKSDLPMAPMDLIRSKKMKTNNLVDFLPLYGPATGDDVPMCLMNARMGSIYSFDPYDSKLTNYNMLVTGSSGSGKSFANNFLLLQQIARGVKVFIIDVGGSYKKMCELFGGQYFEINLSGEYAINPFALKNPSAPPTSEKIKGLVSIIELMVVDPGEKLSRFERVQIESALSSVFEKVRIEKRQAKISDFAQFCEQSSEDSLKRISKLLFPWIGNSPFGKLIDRDAEIGADRPIVAFDLKGISQYPDLQSVAVLILTNFILEQVESDKTSSKRVLLDEAWELLKSPAASSFMEYAARTFRKTGSGITFITQGVEEIINSPIGSAILNNTATKLIMLQKGDTRILQESLKLNSQELRLVQSLEQRKGFFSEGLLIAGETRQVIRIQPSALEYWISTSDAKDNRYLSKLTAEGLSSSDAIKKAAETMPFGMAFMGGATA